MFDEVVESFVFCSIPDPLLGLEELARVVKLGGRVLMLEHLRSANPALGVLLDTLNPVVVRITGANINRDTVENVGRSRLHLEHLNGPDMPKVWDFLKPRVIMGREVGGISANHANY